MIANSRFDPQILTLEEAQNLIRQAVKDEIFLLIPKNKVDARVRDIIRSTLKKIKIPSLKTAAYYSLLNFFNKLRRIAHENEMKRLLIFVALACLKTNNYTSMTRQDAISIIRRSFVKKTSDEILYGQALNIHHERYMRDYVRPMLDKLVREKALDPDAPGYIGRRMTLLARSELEVRYDFHQKQISEFRARGVKLVVVSSHSDCSERCLPWQGRVYSLDGTYGKAPDGRMYIPIEIATNILTPNGKWYNGLFGFNCRHYMREYEDGLSFPNISKEEAKKQYRITQKQRSLERNIRRTRTEALMMKDCDTEEYKRLNERAKMLYKSYKEFSRQNNRAYFPSRTQIM